MCDDPADHPEETVEPLHFANLPEFFDAYLSKIYARNIAGDAADGITTFRWAAKWWEYAEAVSRIDAMWRAFEQLRCDTTFGASVWFREHADHHMPILLSNYGPFANVPDTNRPGDPLPHRAPPAELYPDHREPPRWWFGGNGHLT